MNFIDSGRNFLKNFTEIGLVGPCFEKSVQTNKMIAKLATMPPIEKGKLNHNTDKKTQKLCAYSKKQIGKANNAIPHKTIAIKNFVSSREM